MFLDGPNALLVKKDKMIEYLEREGLAIAWMIIGEKAYISAGQRPEDNYSVQISGVNYFTGIELDGINIFYYQ